LALYRILSSTGVHQEDGEAEVEVRDGMLMLAPSGESVLPIPFGHIVSVSEPEPFTVRLTLAGGDVIELGRLGVMRTQLLAELRDGRGDAAAAAGAAVGEAEAFGAFVAGGAGEVRVYDDALLVIGAGRTERVSFSFAGAVRVRDYAVTVEVTGREPLVLTRLGRRTGELAELLTTRIREASVRTAAFLAALLPGLDPMAVRAAAGLLRDGVAVPASALDGVQPGLAGTLIQLASLPHRRDAVAGLGRRGGLAVGFRQLASVRRPAAGVEPWHDHAAAPHIGEHESAGGAFQPGRAGAMAAGVMAGGPGAFGFGEGFGAFGGYWAFRALGAGMNGRGPWPQATQPAAWPQATQPAGRPMAARPDVTRGRLTPAAEDLSALAVTGESPSVLAFALAAGPGGVAYEVLNRPERETYVFRGDLAAVNRALDDAGFDPAALAPRLAPGGRVPHDERWQDRVAALLAYRAATAIPERE
jgi:hypothetical protein